MNETSERTNNQQSKAREKEKMKAKWVKKKQVDKKEIKTWKQTSMQEND